MNEKSRCTRSSYGIRSMHKFKCIILNICFTCNVLIYSEQCKLYFKLYFHPIHIYIGKYGGTIPKLITMQHIRTKERLKNEKKNNNIFSQIP